MKTLTNYAQEFDVARYEYGKKQKLAYQTMANILREVSNHYHNDRGAKIRETYLEMIGHLDTLSATCGTKDMNEDEFRDHQILVGSCASELMGSLDVYAKELKDDVAEHDYSQIFMIEHFFRQ
jgi:hypothetical protein